MESLLYIEDNQANAKLIQHVVKRYFDVSLAIRVDAESGIEYAIENLPSIILMDINLPGLNGFEALNLLRENPDTSHVPVFALSAAAMPSDVQNGLDAGFNRYITKPIDVPSLVAAIQDEIQPQAT